MSIFLYLTFLLLDGHFLKEKQTKTTCDTSNATPHPLGYSGETQEAIYFQFLHGNSMYLRHLLKVFNVTFKKWIRV